MDTGDPPQDGPKQGGGGPKGKKKKKQTMSLDQFLASTGDGSDSSMPKSQNWALLSENPDDDFDSMPVRFDRSTLPTAPKAAMGPKVDISEIPTSGPFSAYIGNISYDAKEEDLEQFFSRLEVDTVRIITDGGRPRGYAYVDFKTREALLEALTYHEKEYMGRMIRVDLATEKTQDGRNPRSNEPDRTEGDWRRREPGDNDSSFGGRDSDRGSRGYADRDKGFGGDRGFGDRDRGYAGDRDRGFGDRDRGYGGDRDRGFGGDRDRGYGGDRDRGFGGDRDRGFGGDRDRGYGGDRDRGFGGDRDRGGYGDRDRGYGGDRDRGYGGDRDRGYGGDRDRGYGGDRDRGYGGDRDRGYGGDRDRGYGGDRDRGYGGDRDRGYGGDRDRGYGGDRDRGYDRGGDRYGDRDRGYNRGYGGDRDGRGGYGSNREDGGRSGYGGSRGYDNRSDDRYGGRREDYGRSYQDDGFDRRPTSRDGSPDRREAPRERPVLKLQPRSKPADNKENQPTSRPSIFGAAKPVDTYAKEKAIEEKLKKQDESVHSHDRPPRHAGERKQTGDRRHSGDKSERRRKNSGPVLKPAPVSRRDSDHSRTSDDHGGSEGPVSPTSSGTSQSMSPPQMVPAPPPKENAWGKKRDPATPTRAKSENVSNNVAQSEKRENHPSDRRNPAAPPKHNAWGTGGQKADRLNGSQGASRQDPDRNRARQAKERPIPKSIEEMPKYEETKSKDFSDENKFSFLLAEEEDRVGSESDEDREGETTAAAS